MAHRRDAVQREMRRTAAVIVFSVCWLLGTMTSVSASPHRPVVRNLSPHQSQIVSWLQQRYRPATPQIFIVAGFVWMIGVVLRVPWLVCLIGTGAFLAFPLVKDLRPEQWLRWIVVAVLIFLAGHYLLTLFGVIGRDRQD